MYTNVYTMALYTDVRGDLYVLATLSATAGNALSNPYWGVVLVLISGQLTLPVPTPSAILPCFCDSPPVIGCRDLTGRGQRRARHRPTNQKAREGDKAATCLEGTLGIGGTKADRGEKKTNLENERGESKPHRDTRSQFMNTHSRLIQQIMMLPQCVLLR